MIQKSGLVKFCYEGYMNPDFFVDVPILMYYWNIHIYEEGANVSIYVYPPPVGPCGLNWQAVEDRSIPYSCSVLAPEKWV